MMNEQTAKLLASAAQITGAAFDIIEAAREGEISPHDNVGTGDTLTVLVDGLRLLILAMDDDEATQLHGAVVKFLGERS